MDWLLILDFKHVFLCVISISDINDTFKLKIESNRDY